MTMTELSGNIQVYLGLLCSLLILHHTIGFDPCKDASVLYSLYRRLPWYGLSSSDTPLCDSFLPEGWYNVKEFHIATTPPSQCGTSYIWWSNDTLPSVDEIGLIQTKSLCLKTGSSNCEFVESTKMIKCGVYNVYYLKPTIGCPEAYCLDIDGPKPTGHVPAPSVSFKPTIYVERDIEHLKPPFKNKLLFYCNFTAVNDSNLLYTVEWYKGHNILGSLLYESEPTPFTTEHEFKMKTALTEDKMGTIGIHLVCSVMARREKYGIPSTPSTSESFFAGIEVVNKTAVHISSNLYTPTIYIRSTIPFACTSEDHQCSLDVNLFIPSVDECRLPQTGVQGSSGCGVAIPKRLWDQPQPLTIALKESDSAIPTDPIIMEVFLKTLPRFLSHKIFQNHVLPDRVQVHLSRIDMNVLNQKSCHAICDPHMKTFDELYYENQRSGTFVLYSNTEYPAEIPSQLKSIRKRAKGTARSATTTKMQERYKNCFTAHLGHVILPESQCGFQKECGTIGMVFFARQLCHKMSKMSKATHRPFLDLRRLDKGLSYCQQRRLVEGSNRNKVMLWNNNSPYCPCGVAVRAGRDVFVVNKCQEPFVVRMVKCLDGVLHGKITTDGKSFTVNLPTGTVVHIDKQASFDTFGVSYNVIIEPSLTDYGHKNGIARTKGLCGTFDGNQLNDLLKRDGFFDNADLKTQWHDPSSFNEDWRVNERQNLFRTTSHTTLDEWKQETYICECDRQSDSSVTPIASCYPDRRKTCKRDNMNDTRPSQCAIFRKRSTDDVLDEYESFEIDQLDIQEIPKMINKRSAPVTVNYTESIARNACRDHLNSSIVFRKCYNLPNFDPRTYIESCIMDAMISNSMDWADSHIENAKTNCISLVDLNQPIPKESLKQFASLGNSSSLKNTSSGNDKYSTTTPTTNQSTDVSNIFNAELLEELEALSCPLDCNGRGLCRNGSCSCQKGYGDVDCSVDLSQPPITFGIPDRGICDLQKRPCRKTSVLGQHFIESKSLTCRTIYYQILQTGTKVSSDNQTQLAELISDSEVECILPQGRDRREADSSTGDSLYIAQGYRVSVSNDGRLFSRETTLLIFDSACMNCTKAGFDIQCIIQSGFCMMDGRCYQQSKKFGCNICEVTADGSFQWTKGNDCLVEIPQTVKHEESNLWIIGAVLGPVGLLAILGAILISVRKRTRTKKVSVSVELATKIDKHHEK